MAAAFLAGLTRATPSPRGGPQRARLPPRALFLHPASALLGKLTALPSTSRPATYTQLPPKRKETGGPPALPFHLLPLNHRHRNMKLRHILLIYFLIFVFFSFIFISWRLITLHILNYLALNQQSVVILILRTNATELEARNKKHTADVFRFPFTDEWNLKWFAPSFLSLFVSNYPYAPQVYIFPSQEAVTPSHLSRQARS